MFCKFYIYIIFILAFNTNIRANGHADEEWIKYFAPESMLSNDDLTTSAIDSSGNIIATGISSSYQFGESITTIKYDIYGNQIWMSTYDDGGFQEIRPVDMLTDLNGNVYIVGEKKNPKTYYDYLILKYDYNGQELWIATFNGDDNLDDRPASIALDKQGNVYITGKSESFVGYYDYLTLKYDTDGNLKWVQRYDGNANFYDGGVDIATDEIGNVYVTGTSAGVNSKNDIVTIKYSTEGNRQWLKRYNGLNNNYDKATKILIVKDHIYIVGNESDSYGSYDCVTIKYSMKDGTNMWVSRFGNAGKYESVSDIAHDINGKILISLYKEDEGGFYVSLVKYDQNGDELWHTKELMSEIVGLPTHMYPIDIDEKGNIYTGGYFAAQDTTLSIRYSYLLISYDSDGKKKWTDIYDGGGVDDNETKLIHIVDDNNIFISGKSYYPDSGNDYLIRCYDNTGNRKWYKRFGQMGKVSVASRDIGIDKYDNVYIIVENGYSFLILKYDTYGNENLHVVHDAPLNTTFKYIKSYIDSIGNTFLTGQYSFRSNPNTPDPPDSVYSVTMKYNSNGTREWLIHHQDVAIADLKASTNGNVYITGTKWLSYQSSYFVTKKYDKNGIEQWSKIYDAFSVGVDKSLLILPDIIDNTENIFVSGISYGSNADRICTTIKYDSAGNELWTQEVNGTPIDMKLNKHGDVIICLDNYIVKYDSSGTKDWTIERSRIKIKYSLTV